MINLKTIHKPETLSKVSKMVKDFILKNKLYTEMKGGKSHVHVEGWTYAGSLLSLIPVQTSVRKHDTDDAKLFTYESTVDVIDLTTGDVVSRGFAICSKAERSKGYFDEYAVASMAQTRATSKAFRLLIAFIIKDCGFETTPSEEMTDDDALTAANLQSLSAIVSAALTTCTSTADVKRLASTSDLIKKSPELTVLFNARFTELKNKKS